MKANRFVKNDEGVSAVIGVILMVAITVILAAVIAAFVFGMVGGVKKTYNIAATASRAGTAVTVTYNGGPDNDQVKGYVAGADPQVLTGIVITEVTEEITPFDNHVVGVAGDALATVGSSETYTTVGKVHVVVVATFNDATQQVILDSHV